MRASNPVADEEKLNKHRIKSGEHRRTFKRESEEQRRKRDLTALTRIEKLLDGETLYCEACKEELTKQKLNPVSLKAIELRYSRLRPLLSAVESTNIFMDVESLDTQDLMRQIGSSLATNPAMLIDILRSDPQARTSVFQAIDQLKRETLQPVPAIELPQHTTPQ